MKKVKKLSCLLCAMAMLMGVTLTASAATYYTVNASNVNFRKGPGTSYSSYGQLTNGQSMKYLNLTVYTSTYTWRYLTPRYSGTAHYGYNGYVATTYLK